MRILKIIALVLLVVLVGIQFVPTELNQSDIIPKNDFLLVNNPPKNISTLLKKSCYDCHSNNTDYPWYNKTQPIAWFLESHVAKGKEELNFNDWGLLTSRRKASKLNSIIKQIESNEMPLYSYTLLHANAILNEVEKQELIQYITELKNNL